MKLYLHLHLKDDLVLSSTAATSGDHQSLDYIPATVFRGVAAANLYRSRDDAVDDHFLEDALHRGKIRFYDALPYCPDKGVGFPVPLSWYAPKGHETMCNVQLGAQNGVIDTCSGQEEGQDYRQIRKGYAFIHDNGIDIPNLKTSYRMKTAINPETGRAATAQLFGYQSLQRGQQFVSCVETDDSNLLERLKTIFSATLRIGRSRSAEYGRVECTASLEGAIEWPSEECTSDGDYPCLLLSDTQLIDALGEPTYTITASSLGLGDHVQVKNCHVRTRRVAHYNAALRAREPERFLLQRGTTFVLCGLTPEDTVKLTQGVGAETALGYGQTWLAPDYKRAIAINTRPHQRHAARQPEFAAYDIERFKGYIRRFANKETHENELKWVEDQLDHLRKMYVFVLNDKVNSDIKGPSASQWAALREHVANQDKDTIHNILFQDDKIKGNKKICGDNDLDWQREAIVDGRYISFADFLKEITSDIEQYDQFDLAWALQKLATETRDLIHLLEQKGDGQ